MLQDKLSHSTGKIIVLKDLSNLNAKTSNTGTRNDLEATVQILTDKHGECSYIDL